MTQIITRQNYPQPQQPPEKLFNGIFLRWNALTPTEKVVCANIILLPVWWFVGITNYMLSSISLGIIIYEWNHYGELRLKRPSWAVIALFAFFAYSYIDNLLVYLDVYWTVDIPSDIRVNPNTLIKSILSFAVPFLIWYIQSNKAKVRLEVVAWACSISVIQMFIGWLIFKFAFVGWIDNPPRTLYAILTGKKSFDPADVGGWGNYLAFYDEDRVRFFFNHYQATASYLGFVGLISVELKNRVWSFLLLLGCSFLIFLIGSRSVWLALPAALMIRFFITLVRLRLTALVLALLALFSFAAFSLTPVTQQLLATYNDTASTVASARAGSTEIRGLVYKETWERIPDRIFFGHKVEGGPAVEGNATFYVQDSGIRIGSHSFYLGDLLYQKGVLGMGIFVTFWAALLAWFYETRRERPMLWLPVLALFSFQLAVTVLQFTMIVGILMCMLIHQKSPINHNPLTRSALWKN